MADEAIVTSLSLESRSNLMAQLAIEGIFSALQESCIARNESEAASGYQADFASSAKALHSGLKRLAVGRPQLLREWALVAASLRAGWRYFPSALYADKLETALRESKNKRGLFEFKAYRYIDESGPNCIRMAGLFLRWIFLPNKNGFAKELADIKESLKADILRTSPAVSELPRFGGEVFSTAAGEPRLLSFVDPSSQLHGKRAVFAFFETTCTFCVVELKSLGRIYPAFKKKSGRRLEVIGLKLPSNLPPLISGLAQFEKQLKPPFPMLESDTSGMFAAYRVRSVPLLLFLDERGVALWTISLRRQGHIEEKLSWFLEDFLAGTTAFSSESATCIPAPEGAAGKAVLVMDFYYDPFSRSSKAFLENDLPDLERSHGVAIDIALHNAMDNPVSRELQNRLIALRATLTELPVAIVGGRVVQGLPALSHELPIAMKMVARAE